MAAARTLDGLSPNELDTGNRRMPGGADLETALTEGGRYRFHALAVLLWLYLCREDKAAELEPLMDLPMSELWAQLGHDVEADPADPTAPGI